MDSNDGLVLRFDTNTIREEQTQKNDAPCENPTAAQQCWDLLLDQILAFLPMELLWRCQGVGKPWQEMVGSTVWLWKHMILPRELRPRLTPAAFSFMAKSARGTVQEIDLRGSSKVDCSSFLLPGANLVHGVQVLRLNREEHARTLPMALEMCYGFAQLRVLDLRWCPSVDDTLVVNLCRAQCALSLQDVNLRGCLVSDEGVMCMARCCTAMRVLDIGAWPYSRFRGVRTVSDVSLFFIAQCAALRGDSFALESLCIAGRRGTSDEGIEALMEFVPRLNRLDVRHCPAVNQLNNVLNLRAQDMTATGLDPRRTWRYGRFNNLIQVIADTSCEGAVTPDDYGEEYGVVDGWNDVHTATGLWQLLQSIAAVRAAAELQARATAEAQAEDMLVEAAEVQARASEIHAQAIDMQAQAAEILSRVAEVQLQVSSMQLQAEEQGHVAARAQAAEMQAQVAQMQVHAAQMQVHAAQMQIRATEMQGQAAEMQASALNIRAQAATLSFADLTNTAANALMTVAQTLDAGVSGGPMVAAAPAIVEFVEELAQTADDASAVAAPEEDEGNDSGAAPRRSASDAVAHRNINSVSVAAGDASDASGTASASNYSHGYSGGAAAVSGAAAAAAAVSGAAAASGIVLSASARFDALRAETARLTRTVRGLTAQVERVTLREQAHAALLTHEVESVTRRAEAFIAEHRTLAAATSNASTRTGSTRTESPESNVEGEEERREEERREVERREEERSHEEERREDETEADSRDAESAEVGVQAAAEEDGEVDVGRLSAALSSIRQRARSRWTIREEEVAARVVEIERVRARLRQVERERDEVIAAERRQRELERERALEEERHSEMNWGMESESAHERQAMRERQSERHNEMSFAQAASADPSSANYYEEAENREERRGSVDSSESVSDIQGAVSLCRISKEILFPEKEETTELEAMRAEHSRLLARRDAEIESVAAVEARLAQVREERQRLTRTVMDLRMRIERLRESSETAADTVTSGTEAMETASSAPLPAATPSTAATSLAAGERGTATDEQASFAATDEPHAAGAGAEASGAVAAVAAGAAAEERVGHTWV